MKKKPDYYRLHPVLSFRVPLELKQKLEAVSNADGRPVSQWLHHYMIRTLEELVEEHQDSPPSPSVEYVRKKHVRRQS